MDMKKREGQLIVTPNPVTLENQQLLEMDLRPGESLYAFLYRHINTLDGEEWQVAIGGKVVERHLWHHCYPKHGQIIEVRSKVGRSALLIVALIALTIFTVGVGTAMVAAGYTATMAAAAQMAIYVVGSLIINKVLGPKKPKQYGSDADNVYTINSTRNSPRQYEPMALLFGKMRVTPDLITSPYAFYEGNDQYLAMVLAPGLNVGRMDALYNGDVALSSYEGVSVWYNNFPEMASQDIPLYTNVDAVAGGDLSPDDKGEPGPWVIRTSSTGAIRLQIDIEYTLFDTTSKGKPKSNQEQIQMQYRPAGGTTWTTLANRNVSSSSQKTQRVSYGFDVPEGQYDVQVRIAGLNTDGSGATAQFTWTSLTTVQKDDATYPGIPRVGLKIKATGQLSGALDEVRGVAYAQPSPVWYSTGWVTEETSNPGSHILRYARGIYDEDGVLIAGMGLDDSQIDIEAFKSFMLYCADNNFTYDFLIKDARSHLEMMDTIALAGLAQTNWAGGRLSVSWAGSDQPTQGVVNMATIKKGSFQVDYTLAQSADGIEYSYYDTTINDTKTLRVPAPGVETMLYPAQITGEGISTEAHAAYMARWHMAQNLYQYKDISFDADLEHLSYRRMSVLSLQHDMTQWGYGGRIKSATQGVGGVVTLVLDDVVPPPSVGNAFIGLRIPGEAIYRVFSVVGFSTPTDTINLVGVWPSDAAFPGNTDGNPAWDTIWCYDFKATPGLRARVVAIEPYADMKGARVSVVAESDNFWHYVETGEYIPPANESLLQTKPIASNLKVSEVQTVQGDTVFTELQVTFDITGPVGNIVCLSDLDGNVELEEVARTTNRTVSFRIPGAGTYPITIRPFAPDGTTGVSASILYTTIGADSPPVLVDIFDVQDGSGGVRKYTWGFYSDTIQSADFTGVEIRYIAAVDGVPSPAWDTMTPVGDTGYHSSAFEAVVPVAGDWTFACRSVNTSGTLSTGARYVTKVLSKNAPELMEDQQQQIDENTQQIIDNFNELVAEQQAQLALINAQADELAAQAADIADLQAAIDAPVWNDTDTYTKGTVVKDGTHLYVAVQDVPANTPTSDTAYWQDIGEYSTIPEAVGAISVAVDNLETQVTSLDGEVTALATSVDAVESALDGKADASAVDALEARVTVNEGNITANSSAITALQTTVAGKADTSALNALTTRVTTAENNITANSTAITQVKSSIGASGANLLANSGYEVDASGWTTGFSNTGKGATFVRDYPSTAYIPTGGHTMAIQPAGVTNGVTYLMGPKVPVEPGKRYCYSGSFASQRSAASLRLFALQADGSTTVQELTSSEVSNNPSDFTDGSQWLRQSIFYTVPSNVRFLQAAFRQNSTGGGDPFSSFYHPMLEVATADQTSPSAWSPPAAGLDTKYASAISSLQATVTTQGNTITAQGTALTNVQAQIVSNPNLMPNGGWENGSAGWNQTTNFAKFGGSWGTNFSTSAPTANSDMFSDEIAVFGGWQYTYTCDAQLSSNTGAASLRFDIIWYDASHNTISLAFGATKVGNFLFSYDDANRKALKVSGVAPATAVYARVRMAWSNNGATITNIGFRQSKLEIGPTATPYTEEGTTSGQVSATQSLSARVTTTENGVASYNASWVLTLDANGYISGIQSVNNGSRAVVTIRADVFNIIAPAGAVGRTEYSDNSWKVYDESGVKRVQMGKLS